MAPFPAWGLVPCVLYRARGFSLLVGMCFQSPFLGFSVLRRGCVHSLGPSRLSRCASPACLSPPWGFQPLAALHFFLVACRLSWSIVVPLLLCGCRLVGATVPLFWRWFLCLRLRSLPRWWLRGAGPLYRPVCTDDNEQKKNLTQKRGIKQQHQQLKKSGRSALLYARIQVLLLQICVVGVVV